MKKTRRILSALCALAFVSALTACGSGGVSTPATGRDVSAQQTQFPEQETQAPADDPAQSGTSIDLYRDTIAQYGQARVDSMADLGYTIDMPEYKYAIRDVNGDGVEELVIQELLNESGTMIGAIYTLDGDRPVELYFVSRHGQYTITADGYFLYFYHELTIEKLVGTQLVEIATSERLSGEDSEEKGEAFLKANGVSGEAMEFDFIPYNG